MKRTPRVIHILANGERVNSIEGKTIPSDNPVYEIVLRKGEQGKCD